jgi:NAD(P)H-hydrate epimerase
MLPVLTPAQSAAWDARATSDDRSLRQLMECAGRAVAQTAIWTLGEAASAGVLVACGTGNNGGDGWVAARFLHRMGYPVTVLATGAPATDLAADARRVARADGVREIGPDDPWPAVGLVIDAILGTGARGAPRAPLDSLLIRLAELERPVVAVDGPTGLDLGTGADDGALPADHTVTFGGPRRGHLLTRDAVGELHVVEIGLPAADPSWPVLVDVVEARAWLAPFPADAHKGVRGRVVIVGGSTGMMGAARLAARSAFAAGAGLVHVVTDPQAASELVQAEPDVQVRAQTWGEPLAPEIVELVAAADTVIVGPGLGRGDDRSHLVQEVLVHARRAVIDADALHAFADRPDTLRALAARAPVILTPHPGEFRAVFPDIDLADRWAAVQAAADRTGAVVLLKGVPTVIGGGTGPVLTVARGNPGLATGGSGDVLSGIIAALWTARDDARTTAALGAIALGVAAEHAALDHGVRAMRPMDVIAALPECWATWAEAPEPVRDALLHLGSPATR